MIKELQVVALRRDLEGHGLHEGDLGAVVTVYEGDGYEVEFVTGDGMTVALITLSDADIRPMADREILHVRDMGTHPTA